MGFLIGEKTGKVLESELMTKRCRVCQYWRRKGKPARPHYCLANHTGSAKSMEAALAVNMVKRLKKKAVVSSFMQLNIFLYV